jgi:hypothetical protein
VTQQYSPAPPLVFVSILKNPDGLEAAAIAVDRTTFELRSMFAGRIEPAEGARKTPAAEAPRAMLHTELALGIGSVVDGGILVSWWAAQTQLQLEDLLATGGRAIQLAGRLDLMSAAGPLQEALGVDGMELHDVAVGVGLPAPTPHALSHARTSIALLQRIREHAGVGQQWARLAGDERRIAELAVQRLSDGRTVYGPWNVEDGRAYEREAMEEAADGFMYSMAALVRARRDTPRSDRGRIAYLATGLAVDHPTVLATTKRLLSRRILAIHPDRVVPSLVQDGLSEIDAKKLLVEFADEVCAVGSIDHPAVTEAMSLAHAHRRTISFAPVEGLA